tara:strand:- start:266 stop:2992 length:2727 start_codon:yes stop_codon:yes gene_type:complete
MNNRNNNNMTLNKMIFVIGKMDNPKVDGIIKFDRCLYNKEINNSEEGIKSVITHITNNPKGIGHNTEPLFEIIQNHHTTKVRPYFDYDYTNDDITTMGEENFKNLCEEKNKENIDKLNKYFNNVEIDLSISSYNGFDKTWKDGFGKENKYYGKRKISFHYIVSNLYTTVDECEIIATKLGFDTGGAMYSKFGLFRIGKTHKYSKKLRFKKNGKGHRSPILLTNKKDLEKHFITYIPSYCEEYKIYNNIMCFSSLEQKTENKPIIKQELIHELIQEVKQEVIPKKSKSCILNKLPIEYVNNYDKWLKITLYYKSFGNFDDWEEWNKTSNRYIDSWREQNLEYWERRPHYKGDGKKQIQELLLNKSPKRLLELFEIYNGLVNDMECVDDIIKQFKKYFRVVNYKKDDIYYFNRDTDLWIKTNKDYLNCYLSRYYTPILNELDYQVNCEIMEEKKDEEGNDYQFSKWFGKITDADTYLKAKSQFSKNINSQGNTKTKNNFIKEFFLRDCIKDEKFKDKLNKDKHILSVKDGKVNLKTGEVSNRNYEDYISYELDLEYNQDVPINNEWEEFIKSIFTPVVKKHNDIEYQQSINYLQNYLGYCLTGETKEEKILVLMGNGSNGKSKLFSMIQEVLKSNVNITASWEADLFNENTNSKNVNSASPEIARLFGKRLGFINESKKSMVWGETFKKLVDTGTSLPARELYGDTFEFDLETTFIMCSNEFPNFPIQHCYKRRTDTLSLLNRYCDLLSRKDKLENDKAINLNLLGDCSGTKEKKQGILNWLINGSINYYKEGLKDLPKHQKDFKDAYIKGNDWFSGFTFTNDKKDYIVFNEIYENINSLTKCRVDKKDIIQKFVENGAELTRKMIDGKKLQILRNFKNNISEDEYCDIESDIEIESESEDNPLNKGVEY